MAIRHELTGEIFKEYDGRIVETIRSRGLKRILDIGGGANPVVPVEVVRELGLDYTVLDISAEELAKAPDDYRKVVADITTDIGSMEGGFDLAFSKMLAEHVRDGRRFHENVFKLLKPGGIAIHFFPTLWAFPFVVNRLMPEALAEKVLLALTPYRNKSGRHAKFPAYYQWTTGPTSGQIKRLESVGFEIEDYLALYGHGGYYEKLKPVLAIHNGMANFYRKQQVARLTSYSVMTLRKP
jgi:SAM-dependent methyltransferase